MKSLARINFQELITSEDFRSMTSMTECIFTTHYFFFRKNKDQGKKNPGIHSIGNWHVSADMLEPSVLLLAMRAQIIPHTGLLLLKPFIFISMYNQPGGVKERAVR